MKKFLVLYLGSVEALAEWRVASDKIKKSQEKSGMKGWVKWSIDNKKSIIDEGSPIGKTKAIGRDGIFDKKNEVGAFTIVEAKSLNDAAKLFLNHPHFMIFPGDRVEVMECLPIPKK